MNSANDTSEQNQSLWALAFSPAIWTAHFLLSYTTAAIWCGMVVGRDGSLGSLKLAIVFYTVVALLAIGRIGWAGFRRHKLRSEPASRDADTPEDRHRFLAFATLLLSGLSAIAIVYGSLPLVFIGSCH